MNKNESEQRYKVWTALIYCEWETLRKQFASTHTHTHLSRQTVEQQRLDTLRECRIHVSQHTITCAHISNINNNKIYEEAQHNWSQFNTAENRLRLSENWKKAGSSNSMNFNWRIKYAMLISSTNRVGCYVHRSKMAVSTFLACDFWQSVGNTFVIVVVAADSKSVHCIRYVHGHKWPLRQMRHFFNNHRSIFTCLSSLTRRVYLLNSFLN